MGNVHQPDVSYHNADSHCDCAIVATLANMNDINDFSLIQYLCLILTGYRQLTHDFFFFFCAFSVFFGGGVILLSFCEQLFLLCQKALELSCDRDLSEALCTSQAAKLFNQPSELCGQIFNSMNNNVINREYMGIYDKTLNLQNDSNSMIPMHFNIRSLVKTRATCTTLLPRFLFDLMLFVYLNLASFKL